jgi:hypothetical protein
MPNDYSALIFADGTTIEGASCGYAEGNLWCWVTGYTMPQAAQVFLDPAKTERITFQHGETEDVFEGFTKCTNLFINVDEQISACLQKGDVNV